MNFRHIIYLTLPAILVSGCSTTISDEYQRRQLVKDPAPISEPAPADTFVKLTFPMEKRKKSRIRNIHATETTLMQAILWATPKMNVVPKDSLVDLTKIVTVKTSNATVAEYLDYLSGVSDYEFSIRKNTIYVSSTSTKSWTLTGFSTNINSTASVGQRVAVSSTQNRGVSGGTTGTTDSTGSTATSGNSTGINNTNSTLSVSNDIDQWDQILLDARSIIDEGISDEADDSTTDSTGESSDSSLSPITDGRITPWVVGTRSIGVITASGRPSKMKELDAHMKKLLKQSTQQVNMEVKIIDVTLADEKSRGIDWSLINTSSEGTIGIAGAAATALKSGGAWSISTALQLGSLTLNHFINFLSSYGEVSLLSQPNITATNGTTAYISNANQFFYVGGFRQAQDRQGQISIVPVVNEIKVGISLAITPRILDDARIRIEVVPVISSLESFDDVNSNGSTFRTPNIALQELATQVITESGKTIQLGGLISKKLSKSISQLPLGNASNVVTDALLKSVEKELSRRELIISLTPTIVDA